MLEVNFVEVKDIEQFADFAREIWHEYWTAFMAESQIDYMLNDINTEKTVSNQIANEDYTYYYITCNTQRVGYLGMSTQEPHALFLSKLYIIKEFRHEGIGAKAFNFIKNYARQNGFQKIFLTVNKKNREVITSYENWGFRTMDTIATNAAGRYAMDDYVMEYYL